MTHPDHCGTPALHANGRCACQGIYWTDSAAAEQAAAARVSYIETSPDWESGATDPRAAEGAPGQQGASDAQGPPATAGGALGAAPGNVRPLPGPVSLTWRITELVNPGRCRLIASVEDMDGIRLEIGHDHGAVKIGAYMFERGDMPTVLAAIGEAMWAAGEYDARLAAELEGADDG